MPETRARSGHLSVIEAGSPPPAISLQDVVLERGGKALVDGLNLTLSASGTSVLMGPNGAGKSLTLRLMAGLISPDQGKIRWNAVDTTPSQQVALVFQKPVLLRRSVRANLKHALKTYGVGSSERPRRLQELLEMGKLEELADRPARVLSGGEQQRVAMVRALAARPKLLLLDEPTASLDPQAMAAIESLIRTAAAKGAKVLLVTHDAGQAQRLADEIVFLNHGRVTEVTAASQFFDAPRSREGRTYLSGELLF